MEFVVNREMQSDLNDVDKLFKRSLLPWWDDLSVYVRKLDDDLSFQMLPAIVIKAYRYLGLDKKLSIQMANLFKTIYFSNKIHIFVKDEEEGQELNQEMQFTILIGDYIFGKILSLLLENQADELLDMFAAMICEINEGLIIQYKMDRGLQEVLARTRAPLYTNTFRSAAELAGMDEAASKIYSELGYNLGMALELIYVHGQKGLSYIDKAKQLFGQLHSDILSEDPALENLLQELGR